jgi:hypothetical protein
MPHARVNLRPAGWPGSARDIVLADASGRFSFSNLRPGSYALIAGQTGYLSQRYVASNGGPGTISLSAGQQVKDLEIRLTPGATVRGTVVNQYGFVAPRALVRLESLGRGGTLRLARADRSGAFKAELLPAGLYTITAEPGSRSGLAGTGDEMAQASAGPLMMARSRSGFAAAFTVMVEVRTGESVTGVKVMLPPSEDRNAGLKPLKT